MQHRSIADSQARRNVWRIQNRTDFVHRQMLNELVLVAFGGDRTDLAHLLQNGGDTVFHITHEGLDRGQSHIAGCSTVAALAFDMDKEVLDQSSIKLLEVKLRWPF